MNSPRSVDVDNVLNQLEADSAPTRRPLILWLLVFGLLIFFLPLFLISTTIRNDTTRLEAELANLQLAAATDPTPDPLVQALQTELTETQAQAQQFSAAQNNLAAEDVDWPAVAAALSAHDPAAVSLTGLAQAENRLTLSGRASSDTAVINYAQQLETSGLFSRVVVQSIVLLPTATPTETPTPSPTPSVTPTPDSPAGGSGGTPAATITLTPDLRDDFEVDDAHPVPIFVGQAQARNFYPASDVDNAVFLAKADRYYRVTTANLAPGVDTILTLTIGDVILTNDDSKPGTLASEMYFHVPGGDIEVLVHVANRGQFGPNMSYQLLVQEFVPTVAPTATPAPSATPGPSATPTSPPPTPTYTPTATPDLRDPYEPNDRAPSIIAVGETQTHNFYPTGDVDKISFLTKANRFYQVATSNLALGVDTFMVAEINGQQWQNDDYAPPGSGNFASSVCFPAAVDTTAVITTTNKMQQFNPGSTYNVTVLEVPAFFTSAAQLSFGPVVAGGANPPTQTLQITGDPSLAWTVASDSAWLHAAPGSGGAPAWVDVTVNIAGLPAGTYQGNLTFAWAATCRRTVAVTLQIDPAASSAHPHRPLILARQAAQPGGAVEFVLLLELK